MCGILIRLVLVIGTLGSQLSVAIAAVSDGFDFPLCPPTTTETLNDYDGCYVALNFGEYNHAAEDWNGDNGGNKDEGKPVFSVSNGIVISAQDEGAKWGNVMLIEHTLPDGSRVRSLYGHLKTMQKTTDDIVFRGEQIGEVGRGYYYGSDANGNPIYDYLAHLHFEIRTDATTGVVNPYRLDRTGWTDPTNFILSHRNLSIDTCSIDQAVPDPRGIFGEIGYHQILAFQPTGQEFVPTQSEHLEISLFLGNINTSSAIAPVTLSIRPITIFGPAVATSTITPAALLPGESDWVTFDLSNEPGRFLTPGQTYVIDVATTTDRWMWWNIYEDPSLYPDGRWVLFGEPVADGSSGSGTDFVFRTCTKQPSQISSCGNGICESGEDFINCSADCVVIFGVF